MAQHKPIDTIGSVEVVDFPTFGLKRIPAKIDTGAENSSIWASNINVVKGQLQFMLFAPGSTYHTGKYIKTKNFRTASVKNSFGQKEFRYTVPVSVTIGTRRILAWFSLSNRTNMTYPVLIGKNVLRNKFIVDVSKLRIHSKRSANRKILILTTNVKQFEPFFESVGQKMKTKAEITIRDYDQLAFSIESGKVKVTETVNNRDIAGFEVVYLKSHRLNYAAAVAAAQYLSFKGSRVFDNELLTHIAYDKLSAYMRLALHNMPVPPTIGASTQYLINNSKQIGEKLGWPLVCKEINSDKGKKNYLVQSSVDLRKLLKKAGTDESYILQSYIPNKGFIRALVFDRDVEVVIKRNVVRHKNPLKQHLNTPTGSSNTELVPVDELSPVAYDLAVRSAVLMDRQIAGVDLMRDSDSKKWLILEVNNSPQLKSGAFVEQKEKAFAKFVDTELNR